MQLTAFAKDNIDCCLQGRFDPDNFTQEVADVAQKLVPLTVTLWNKVSAKMLPTPAKFHYLFNMRELSKVSCCSMCRCRHCVFCVLKQWQSTWQCDHALPLWLIMWSGHDADCALCASGFPRCDLSVT